MITLENDRLMFRFSDIHTRAECGIQFQRTLRIPNDDQRYPLPPGLGNFPLRHLDDYVSKLGSRLLERGGVVMPMYQSEALWINFNTRQAYPFAIKIATGKICAVSGERWFNHLNLDPQDYVVLPQQPWLDGYCIEKGTIRQFVAAPLGSGHAVEEQVTGEAIVGGIQIVVYPMKRDYYQEKVIEAQKRSRHILYSMSAIPEDADSQEMNLAAGGRMSQEIFEDTWDLQAWDMRNGKRCFVTIANSEQWLSLTGELPPTKPIDAKDYAKFNLPWFDYYGDTAAVEGSKILSKVKPIGKLDSDGSSLPDESIEVVPDEVIAINQPKRKSLEVREFLQ
ncbi:MAG: hypothetical protein F4W92_08935 [Gammaproteobacteria bacterium]|nr:hypothetical protein [Gammaproteobacteria bacterium]